MKFGVVSLNLLLLIALSSCKQPPKGGSVAGVAAPAKASSSDDVKEYKLVGTVFSVDANAKSAMIKNEDIPGFMSPMTMSYPVPEASDLALLKAGDHIRAVIYKRASDERYWLGKVEVLPSK